VRAEVVVVVLKYEERMKTTEKMKRASYCIYSLEVLLSSNSTSEA